MTTIYLTKPLMQLVDILAEQRNRKEKIFGDSTYGQRVSPLEAHTQGLKAEVAVAHHYDLDLDVTMYEDRGDFGVDLYYKGVPVSVKSTNYRSDPYLRVEERHFLENHLYVCCAVQGREVDIVGWASWKDVLAGEKKRLMANGPMNYILTKDQLKTLK
jgi:hypothetical protein